MRNSINSNRGLIKAVIKEIIIINIKKNLNNFLRIGLFNILVFAP